MTRGTPLVHVVVLATLLSCGGTVQGSSDAGPDASGDTADDVARDDAGYGQCTSPSGYRVCGGTGQCTYVEGANRCICWGKETSSQPNVCGDNKLIDQGYDGAMCNTCPDGSLCGDFGLLATPDGELSCMPYEMGILYLKNGATTDRIRYYDRGLFDGGPIPNPTVCPSLPGIRVCGGSCGGCPLGQYCVGRSPLHPVGFCYTPGQPDVCSPGKHACSDGRPCFTFKVEPEAQPIADKNGLCIPLALCQALAQSLPGGGTCTP